MVCLHTGRISLPRGHFTLVKLQHFRHPLLLRFFIVLLKGGIPFSELLAVSSLSRLTDRRNQPFRKEATQLIYKSEFLERHVMTKVLWFLIHVEMAKHCQNNYPSVKIVEKTYCFRQGLLNALTHNINIYGTYSVHMYTNIYSSTYCIFLWDKKRGV